MPPCAAGYRSGKIHAKRITFEAVWSEVTDFLLTLRAEAWLAEAPTSGADFTNHQKQLSSGVERSDKN
jgi:hypothetical protein